MEDLFRIQAFGDKNSLLDSLNDEKVFKFAKINYGSRERLNNNKSFVGGYNTKPAGAKFYPADITKDEIEKSDLPAKVRLNITFRRDENGKLKVIPYHVFFAGQLKKHPICYWKATEITRAPTFLLAINLETIVLLKIL